MSAEHVTGNSVALLKSLRGGPGSKELGIVQEKLKNAQTGGLLEVGLLPEKESIGSYRVISAVALSADAEAVYKAQ